MKYKDLIQFEPISEVIKFARLNETDYRQSLVRNFVFSNAYASAIIPDICRNLDYTSSQETYGLQIVGNYGTGKSHLMSLFSLIAEDADYLPLVNDDKARQVLANIAGKYKNIRFELGNDDELWKIVCFQIDRSLEEFGVDYKLTSDISQDTYYNKLQRMMAYFEAKFPDKGLMVVIDEMLAYLKGRSDGAKINRDLAVLQALGQMSDHSRFRMVFGVQEQIYTAPELQFAADMLKKVNDRFRQIEITQQDVQFVVQKRLLRKTDDQRQTIQQHLSKFGEFFPEIHSNLNTYVELFPVHPSFFNNFERISIGKSHRQVMRSLSKRFEALLDVDVPEKEPGLICYDSYWSELQSSEMQIYPDVRRVNEIMNTIHAKIDDNFTGARQRKAALAHRIANACAIKILQDSLEKTNGASAETLVDDLCYIDDTCFSREFLVEAVSNTAEQIITATVGQYFEKNTTNQEYHLRVEGGVNYEQKIKDFAQTMGDEAKDNYFFDFLTEYMPIEVEKYRLGFPIYAHSISWGSHKAMLNGYIFMGVPSERSTTHPEQHFYIYFMPIFKAGGRNHGDEADSVYFHLDKMSDETKRLITLYGAATALMKSVDSSQQGFYKTYLQRYVKDLVPLFDQQFRQNCEVIYQGELQIISPQMMSGGSKIDIVSNITSKLLEGHFNQEMPDYPNFSLLNQPLSKSYSGNRGTLLKLARQRIAGTTAGSHESDAILAGLGLLKDNQLSTEGSIYAHSVKSMLEQKGEGQVVNRNELLYQFYESDWLTTDYKIEADLEFLVLTTMVAMGEIEIHLGGGKNINATNLKETVDLAPDAFYNFTHVSRPRGMNVAAVRELFLGIMGRDMTAQIENPAIYEQMVLDAKKLAASAVTVASKIKGGILLEGNVLMSENDAKMLSDRLTVLARCCDQAQQYNTPARMRNLNDAWTPEQLKRVFADKAEIKRVEDLMGFRNELQPLVNYLVQAKQYLVNDEQRTRFDAVLDKLPQVVEQHDKKVVVDAYKAELNGLIEWYADWYLDQYNKMHITQIQAGEKNRIMQSKEKQTLEIICGADHAHDYIAVCDQFTEWCNQMAQITPASSYVTREAILRTPYTGGFNPAMYQGKTLPSLSDMRDKLNAMYNSADEALSAAFEDPAIKANFDALSQDENTRLTRYTSKTEELSTVNAQKLMEILQKLQHGIQRVEITMQELRSRIGHAVSPKEAKRSFNAYIDELTSGYDEENVRIIIK